MPTVYGVIPARYASTRFPGKPLVDIHGKSMIQRVYERCLLAESLAEVIVATDDERIADAVVQFGGKVEMTDSAHESGTARLTEVAQRHPAATHFINIQGDEPFVHPSHVNQLAALISQPEVQVGTLARRLYDLKQLQDPSIIKLVMGEQGQALYFSRLPIPYYRGDQSAPDWIRKVPYWKHIHLYGFRRDILLQYPNLPVTELEQIESLEQLRWMAHGFTIQVGISELESYTIEVPADLENIPSHYLRS